MIKYHTEAERDVCERRMRIITKILSFIFIIPVIFAVIQIINGIVSFWNVTVGVISLAIALMILSADLFFKFMIFIIEEVFGIYETTPQEELDREQRELEEDMRKNPEKYKELERRAKSQSLHGHYSKVAVLDIFVRILLSIALIIGACFSLNYEASFKTKNPGCSVVAATVINQIDQTVVVYDEEKGEKIEYRECFATLQYTFDGEVIKRDVIFKNIGKIKVTTFDIYVDANGQYLTTTVKTSRFCVLGIFFIVMAILLLSSIILKFSHIFYFILGLFAIGPILLVFVGLNVSLAELLYFDLSTFILFFSCTGVYLVIAQYIGRIILVGHVTIEKPQKKEDFEKKQFSKFENKFKDTDKFDY